MREIRLFCAAGMSTSILVNKMRKAVAEQELGYEVNAFSVSQIETEGPQVGYKLKAVQEALPDKHVEVIDFTTYGMMDGAKLIKKCREFFED